MEDQFITSVYFHSFYVYQLFEDDKDVNIDNVDIDMNVKILNKEAIIKELYDYNAQYQEFKTIKPLVVELIDYQIISNSDVQRLQQYYHQKYNTNVDTAVLLQVGFQILHEKYYIIRNRDILSYLISHNQLRRI